ncbi:hypothetical protein I6A60_21380 [Frankia sp. AgB1.9]|uniref:hypothetical protein n=1 Tax=unclassified Frankia TaxID=2632575 RepID=UPI0019331E05|nr:MULTISPECIES: hypothetical protein [unclassified Frankia]MBL7487962.1 hypothetical protein [Frankia sp. AgW1.1]MBL7550405.1 hypothetical protein [Frankia sp. AgB1.9]MBL7620875.1 hypothetical protein [Frankia sp. AgB1.8]
MRNDARQVDWARVREVIVFIFTIGTSVAALSGLTGGAAQVVLRVIAAVSAGYLLSVLLRYFRLTRDGIHASVSSQLRQREEDIEDTFSRQAEANEEKVHVQATIGLDDTSDKVEETVEVHPNRQLVARMIRPITTSDRRLPKTLSDFAFRAWVDDSANGPAWIRSTVLRIKGRLYVWLIFTPTLTKPVTWHCSYAPRGLWADLRKSGHDKLIWNDIMPANGRSPMTDFRVSFVFKDPRFAPNVREKNGFGACSPSRRVNGGSWVIEWHDPNPQGRRYEWEVSRRADPTD